MFRYRVYGLTLAARVELPLNFADGDGGPVDFLFEVASDGSELARRIAAAEPHYVSRTVVSGEPAVALWKGDNDGEYLFRFYDGIAFLVDRERGVVACHCASASQVNAASHHLLFSLIGFLLASRNATALHGAAIRCDAGVVALLGRPKSGKSRVSVELAAAGADVVSDELVAVRHNAGTYEVSRGYPWVSIRTPAEPPIACGVAASAPEWRYLGETYRSHPLPKNASLAARRSPGSAEELALMCILSPGAYGDPSIEHVSPRDACLAVMEAAARTHVPLPDLAARELDIAAQLASSVPACRLEYQVPNGGLARAFSMALRATTLSLTSRSCWPSCD